MTVVLVVAAAFVAHVLQEPGHPCNRSDIAWEPLASEGDRGSVWMSRELEEPAS